MQCHHTHLLPPPILIGSQALSSLTNNLGSCSRKGGFQLLLGGAIVRADTWRRLKCCLWPAAEAFELLLGSAWDDVFLIFRYLALLSSAEGIYAIGKTVTAVLYTNTVGDHSRASTYRRYTFDEGVGEVAAVFVQSPCWLLRRTCNSFSLAYRDAQCHAESLRHINKHI